MFACSSCEREWNLPKICIELGVRGSPLLPHDSTGWLAAQNVNKPRLARPKTVGFLPLKLFSFWECPTSSRLSFKSLAYTSKESFFAADSIATVALREPTRGLSIRKKNLWWVDFQFWLGHATSKSAPVPRSLIHVVLDKYKKFWILLLNLFKGFCNKENMKKRLLVYHWSEMVGILHPRR